MESRTIVTGGSTITIRTVVVVRNPSHDRSGNSKMGGRSLYGRHFETLLVLRLSDEIFGKEFQNSFACKGILPRIIQLTRSKRRQRSLGGVVVGFCSERIYSRSTQRLRRLLETLISSVYQKRCSLGEELLKGIDDLGWQI